MQINNYLRKKDQGLIEHYLPMVLTLIFFGILMMACASWSSWVDKSDELNQVCRKYMLRMEVEGYLTSTDKTNMTKELTNLGVSDINIQGTTTTEVSYGNIITLHVEGKVKLMNVVFKDLSSSIFQEIDIPWTITKQSTAKN